jgi:hypothetical protein
MPIRPNQASPKSRLFWRRLVSAVAIYALALQPLLLAIAGTQSAQAAALGEITLSQLCLHDSDGSPVSPSDQQQYPTDHRCVQCLGSAVYFIDAPHVVTVAPIDHQFRKLRHAGLGLRLSSSSQYSIACPRGPPLNV